MGVGGVGGNRHVDHSQADAAEEASLPRTGWTDQSALSKAVDKAKASVEASASRPNHKTKWVDAKKVSSHTGAPASIAIAHAKPPAKPDKPAHPVIVAKYGVPANHGGGSTPSPVIVAKYGVPANHGGGGSTPSPVIVAKYGVPGNWGGGGSTPSPVIVAKYGVPANHGGSGGGTHPVIVAKYGVPANIHKHR